MEMPEQVKIQCDHLLEKVRQDAFHYLSGRNRLTLYDSFGPTSREPYERLSAYIERRKSRHYIPSASDRVISWLAIITFRKLISLWESYGFDTSVTLPFDPPRDSDNPFLMLVVAESVMAGFVKPEEALYYVSEVFYWGTAELQNKNTPQKMLDSVIAAKEALSVVSFGIEHLRDLLSQTFAPELMDDFVLLSLYAYCPTDSSRKSLHEKKEFWEWWLTEAIPQAWAIVE